MQMRTLGSRALACALLLAAAMAAHAQATVSAVYTGLRLVPTGTNVPGTIQARVTNGGVPMAGVSVLFSAPASGPSIVFADGGNTASAVTDASGIATVNGVGNDVPGFAPVQASAGTSSATVAALVIPGPVSLEAIWPPHGTFGDLAPLELHAHMPWYPCAYAASAPSVFADGAVSFTANGFALPTSLVYPTGCTSNGTYEIVTLADVSALVPGRYDVSALYTPGAALHSVQTQGTLTVDPDVQVATASGSAAWSIGAEGPKTVGAECARLRASAGRPGDDGFPASGPPGVAAPFGLLRLDATDCRFDPAVLATITPPPVLMQHVTLGTGTSLAPGALVYAYGPTVDNRVPHWYPMHTMSTSANAYVDLIDGLAGDDSVGQDGELHALLALAWPVHGALMGSLQDLWWVGPQENGWGMTLTQHGEKLFAGLFVYDAKGDPRWLVMSGGAWNAAGTVYSGSLYRPHGSSYVAYDATAFVPGAAVGTLDIRPQGDGTLVIAYTIDGVTGTKTLQRQLFGPATPFFLASHDDLWWGGLKQNGWGVALAQQYDTSFGVLYTYDDAGDPIWFVAPALRTRSDGVLASTLYVTHGSPWLGVPYDPSKLNVTAVGTLQMALGSFTGELAFSINGTVVDQPIERQPF